jgi:membrane-associated phospholipid phosphatase
MYAGVGGEWLYRPWHSPLSFGVDVNAVRQRDFEQRFELREYSVMTGHATLNLDTGWKNTHLSLSAGRYLAGDLGMTLDVSRTFNNGVSIGAWATKTNVSAEQFGEGSFDKGIYLRIPFDAMMTSYSGSVANLVWQPIVRDGGAKLSRNVSLYNLTKARDKRQTSFFSALDGAPTVLADADQSWLVSKPWREDMSGSVRALGSGLASMDWGRATVWGGGLLLASSLLDRPMDNWAKSKQTGTFNSAGEAASAFPYWLAGGSGLLALGFGDKMASDTAWSSIKAAGFTLGGTLALKAVVGRSLPKSELGTTDFNPFGGLGRDSAFPSNHVGVAFALVTPFAQQYNKPWLYALAASTALGRIQQREHFFSDTVASGFLGYVAGSLMRNYQSDRRKLPTLEIGPNNSVRVTWEHE